MWCCLVFRYATFMHSVYMVCISSLFLGKRMIKYFHLLIHCSTAKMLWNLLLAIADYKCVFPLTVRQALLAWQSARVGKKRKSLWVAAPLCLFWTMWNERNRTVFDNETPSAFRMKSSFLFTLWSWAKMFSDDNLSSLVDFLTWLGYR